MQGPAIPDDDPAHVLSAVPLFAGLDRVALAKLAAHFEHVRFGPGEIVFREGDPGDAFYVVLHGAFSDYVGSPDTGADRRLATRGRGATFGDIALLSNRPRSTTVRADAAAEALRLERGRFLGLVAKEPAVALAIAAGLSERVWLANVRGVGTVEARGPATAGDPSDRRAPARGAAESRAASPLRSALGGALAVSILVVTWVTPPPAGLEPAGWRALGTLGAMVPVLALEVLPEGVLALLTIAVWTLGGVAPGRVGLAGFATPSWVLVVAVLVFGGVLVSTGVLYRLALGIVGRARGGFAGQAAALALAGVALGPAVPNATGRVAFLAPALAEVIEALGYAPGSRPAAGLALAALVGFGQMGAVFLTSSTTAVLAHAVLPGEVRAGVGWVGWAVCAAPANALLLAGMLAALVWLYRPASGRARAGGPRSGALAMQRALLGRPVARGAHPSGDGRRAPPELRDAAAPRDRPGLAGRAGARAAGCGRPGDGRHASRGELELRPPLRHAGQPARRAGRDRRRPLARRSRRPRDGWPRGRARDFVGGLAVLGGAASLVLRWQAAAPHPHDRGVARRQAAGISPLVVAVVATIACNGFFAPYQSTTYLALYHGTGGRLFDHRLARPAALAYGAASLLALCASVPVWRWMGLLSRAVRECPRAAGRSPADARRGGVDDEAPHGRAEVPAESPASSSRTASARPVPVSGRLSETRNTDRVSGWMSPSRAWRHMSWRVSTVAPVAYAISRPAPGPGRRRPAARRCRRPA